MGHQIQVFLSAQDEVDLISDLQQDFGAILIRPVYYKDDEQAVASLSDLGMYPTDCQLGLAGSEFLGELAVTRFPEGHFRVDLINSPVIQYNRGSCLSAQAIPGRFWYQLEAKDGEKSAGFQSWSASIFRFLKKRLAKLDSPAQSYAGAEVAEKHQAGDVRLRS